MTRRIGDANLVPLGISIPADQHAELAKLSERTRVPSAVYIREAIDMVLARNRERAVAFWGVFTSEHGFCARPLDEHGYLTDQPLECALAGSVNFRPYSGRWWATKQDAERAAALLTLEIQR